MKAYRWLVLAMTLGAILLGGPLFHQKDLFAESQQGFKTSDSFRSSPERYGDSSSWSSPTQQVWGQRSGGGFFGGSTQSSSGYSKPTRTQGSSSSYGYSKPSSPTSPGSLPRRSDATTSYRSSSFNTVDKTALQRAQKKRAMDSLRAYKNEQAKFKERTKWVDPSTYRKNPAYQRATTDPGFNYGDHYKYRDRYYESKGWSYPKQMHRSSSSFGLWDAALMWLMLNKANDARYAAFAHNNANDSGYKQWRKEADRLAKDDAELKQKLDKLDSQLKKMAGTPTKPGYLPDDVPVDLAVSPSVLAKKKARKPLIRFATGQPGGVYSWFGREFKKFAGHFDVQLIQTEGSVENLRLLSEGKADLAVIQSDVLTKLPRNTVTEQAVLYPEVIQLIANRESSIKQVKDIDPEKNLVYVGPKESGTALTWQGLCEQDKWYAKIPVRYGTYHEAMAEVARNPKALMMFVGGLNSDLLKEAEKVAEKTRKLRLVAVNDWDFNDKKDRNGNAIYTFVDVPAKTYPYLQSGWVTSSDLETLAVKAVLTMRTEWGRVHGPGAMDQLTVALVQAVPKLLRHVHGK